MTNKTGTKPLAVQQLHLWMIAGSSMVNVTKGSPGQGQVVLLTFLIICHFFHFLYGLQRSAFDVHLIIIIHHKKGDNKKFPRPQDIFYRNDLQSAFDISSHWTDQENVLRSNQAWSGCQSTQGPKGIQSLMQGIIARVLYQQLWWWISPFLRVHPAHSLVVEL